VRPFVTQHVEEPFGCAAVFLAPLVLHAGPSLLGAKVIVTAFLRRVSITVVLRSVLTTAIQNAACRRILWTVPIVLRPQVVAFASGRVAIALITTLVIGQWRKGRYIASIETVPPTMGIGPVTPPILVPTRRPITVPSVKIRWRIGVITHGNTQDEERHIKGIDDLPRTVVPIAREPAVVVINPIEPVVEEVIATEVRCVIDGVTRDRYQLRIGANRQVDAFTTGFDINDRLRGRHPVSEHKEYGDRCQPTVQVTHVEYSRSIVESKTPPPR